MEQLATLAAQIEVPAIVVILLIRELRPILSRNGKHSVPKEPCKTEIVNAMKEIELRQEKRDEVGFGKLDAQTQILQDLNTNTKLMHQELKRQNGGS